MKLTNKQKALACTVGLIAGAVAMAHILKFIFENVSLEVIGYVCGLGVLFFFASMIYQIMLSRFEYEDSVKKMVDQK